MLRAARRLADLLAACVAVSALLALVGVDAARASTAGMQLHVLWSGIGDAEVDRQLDRAVEGGAGMARVDVGWASLEQERKGAWSAYHLRRLDAVVDKAEARGLKLLLTLADSPCWASSAPASVKAGCAGNWWERDVERYLPTNPEHFGDALAFLARRYGTRVAAWEMWNEPNQDHFSRGPDKAARYAALVKASYAEAKAAAPGVTFLAGALSESDLEFAEALYRAGVRGSFDAFSVHPYANDVSPLDRREGRSSRVSFVRGVPAMRELMLRFGDAKPLWLTEFGWSTCSVRGQDPWDNGVAEAAQARFVREALDHLSAWDYVPVAIYYGISDLSGDRSERTDNYGLLRRDGTEKPAFAAFRAGAQALGSGVRRPAATAARTLEVAAGGTSST
ncbi:MAG: cellulase family glycosylhydrolase, partial [Actinomycetota bacterium]|nr:cellulase family glycosylhydrolase [Actinomycetota bacterium]